MANHQHLVPSNALERMKWDIAQEVGVDLRKGPDLTTREVGRVGGGMVRTLIRFAEEELRRREG